ncbi:VOC family protein [Deinococcus planocerae]|uniref:VOC family protein n=1 Tax=Deinococcus planocerae TaxID=1737569 RepID=UPI000C7EE7D7|nr:VOC family protein [Deinococcus planocerae]
MTPVLDHVSFKVRSVAATGAFYAVLGAEVTPYSEERLGVRFGGGTRLIFQETNRPFSPDAVDYLGLECGGDAGVDELFARLAASGAQLRDVRAEFASSPGPYGFFLRDPDGYLVKVFHYHEET